MTLEDVLVAVVGLLLAGALIGGLLKLLLRLFRWLVAPKEWFGGTVLLGSFRPRASTVALVALKVLLALLVVAAAIAVSIAVSINWLAYFALVLIVFIPVWTKRQWARLRDREQSVVQGERDRRAQGILQALESETPKPSFCLYLRPFTATSNLRIVVRRTTYHDPRNSERIRTKDDFDDFETVLARAFDPSFPLVALGRPGEMVGAGRIATSDQDWRRKILLLAHAAHAIVLIPSTRAGTLWELRAAMDDENLLRKTIFIIPPSAVRRQPLGPRQPRADRTGAEAALIGDLPLRFGGPRLFPSIGSRHIVYPDSRH